MKQLSFHVKTLVSVLSVLLTLSFSAPVFAAKQIVPYCVDPNWLPYEAIEGGKHVGLSSDYIQLIEQSTDYDFELVVTQSWQQSLDYLESNRCILSPILNQTDERSLYLDFSEVYFSSPNVLISVRDQPFLQGFDNIGKRTLAVTEGYRIVELLETYYPEINTIVYPTEEAGLLAASKGETDLFVGSMLSVNNQIHLSGLTNLKIAGWGGPEDALRMGVTKNNEALLSEINRVLSSVSEAEHFEIYNKWNNVAVIDNTNYRLVWQVLVAGLAILSIVLARYIIMQKYNRALTKTNKQLHKLQNELEQSNSELKVTLNRDALTQLYNRHYFNQMIATKEFVYDANHPLCLVFLDLDHFKHINDTHGHIIGDNILREFAGILKELCHDKEMVCRWGGEEFTILKPNSNLDQTRALCEKIQSRIKNQIFSHKERLTCSFGIAELQPDEPLINCFERADKSLYQAKNEGRDRICLAG